MGHQPKRRNVSISIRLPPSLNTAIDDYIAAEHARTGWKIQKSQVFAKALSQFLGIPFED